MCAYVQEHEVRVKIFKAFTVHCSVMSLGRRHSTRSQANHHLPKLSSPPLVFPFSPFIPSSPPPSLSFSFQFCTPPPLHFLSLVLPLLQPWAGTRNERVSEPGHVKQQLACSQSAAFTALDDCAYACNITQPHTLLPVFQQRVTLMDWDNRAHRHTVWRNVCNDIMSILLPPSPLISTSSIQHTDTVTSRLTCYLSQQYVRLSVAYLQLEILNAVLPVHLISCL